MQTVFRLACAVVAGGIAVGAQTQSTPQFRAGVEVVHLNVAVVDSRGRLVSGLGAQDFAVYEDGELRPLVHFSADPAPVSLGILVDSGASMRDDPQKLAWVRSVIGGLLNRSSPEGQVFVFEFWLGRWASVAAVDDGSGSRGLGAGAPWDRRRAGRQSRHVPARCGLSGRDSPPSWASSTRWRTRVRGSFPSGAESTSRSSRAKT